MARVAPDSNDVMVIALSEAGPTRTNTGTAGTAGNWTDYGHPFTGVQGLYSDAMYIPSSYLVNAADGSGGANDILVTPNVSLSGWIYVRRYTNYAGEIFNKQYFLNAWNNPWLTFGFQFNTSNDGQCDLYITIGGTLQSVLRTPAQWPIPARVWTHIGGTWNGTTMKFYINGTLVTSANYTGTIDYNSSSARGQWYVGGIPGNPANQTSPIIVQDIRIANIERPQSYFANIYNKGMYVNG